MMHNFNEINALLESDDELPTDYHEESELDPAYKNDNRFDLNIKFDWIHKIRKLPTSHEHVKLKEDKAAQLYNEDTIEEVISNNPNKKALITKKVLEKQDVYCLSHTANKLSDKVLLWFFNFLLYKDLHSQFNYQKSCLVVDNFPDCVINSFSKANCHYSKHNNKYKFDVVISSIY